MKKSSINFWAESNALSNWYYALKIALNACWIIVYMLQELQRRLDQTLGKPGSYHHGVDREGHIKPMTIGARLYRLENQVHNYELFEAHIFL